MPRSESKPQSTSQELLTDYAPEDLSAFRGQWVAFSSDGNRLLMGASTLAKLEAKLRAAGEDPEETLLQQIPNGDAIGSGSELS